jgi:hypothetical protein
MSQADNMRFVTLLTFVFGPLLIENDENNDTCIKKTYCPSCSQGKFKRLVFWFCFLILNFKFRFEYWPYTQWPKEKGQKDKQRSTKHRKLKIEQKSWGWTQVPRKGRQFLLHMWHSSCYSWYKLGDKSWMRKGSDCDNDNPTEHIINGNLWHRYSVTVIIITKSWWRP